MEAAVGGNALEVTREKLDEMRRRLQFLLSQVGKSGSCRLCGDPVIWVQTKSGKPVPLEREGEIHYQVCRMNPSRRFR